MSNYILYYEYKFYLYKGDLRMLDNRMKTFLSVCECGSFVAAAKELHITQPAVSQHIRSLEEELGVCLLERTKSKLILTKYGETVRTYAKKATGLYGELLRSLHDEQNRITHLTVGVTHTAESNPIAGALASYCAQNPGVNIKMMTDTISNLYTMLKSYEIDLAVVEGRGSDPDLRYLLLDTDYLVLAVPPEHPFASKSAVTLNELRGERLILRLPDSGTRNLFVSHLESNNMNISDFNVVLEVDNIATIKDLIRRDFGVSILARSALLDELKKGKIVALPVENLSMMREIHLVYRADFTRFDLLRDMARTYNETLRLYK